MNGRMIDVAIAGGGLAGGLVARALHRVRPALRIALLEAGEAPGGNHRWSWFGSDLSSEGAALLTGFRTTEWSGGYDVFFPDHSRHLSARYHSLASPDFEAGLRRELAAETIRTNCPVAQLDARGVSLASGERIEARVVIDCRGWEPSPYLAGGWQLFMGRHIRTPAPHRISRPVIMDATVEQHGAYRFVYVLPVAADELFIEDTYYADRPMLDRDALSGRIDRYMQRQGWDGEILGGETGVLPVITGGDFGKWQASLAVEGVARAGARGGFLHPLTSYTLPWAVETALAIAAEADLPGPQLAAMLDARARSHWRRTKFYRRLGAMLFQAAAPDQRYRIFERFYRLPEPLIERFYAARSTGADRRRVLCGKPPVPVGRALGALLSRGQPLIGPVGLQEN